MSNGQTEFNDNVITCLTKTTKSIEDILVAIKMLSKRISALEKKNV